MYRHGLFLLCKLALQRRRLSASPSTSLLGESVLDLPLVKSAQGPGSGRYSNLRSMFADTASTSGSNNPQATSLGLPATSGVELLSLSSSGLSHPTSGSTPTSGSAPAQGVAPPTAVSPTNPTANQPSPSLPQATQSSGGLDFLDPNRKQVERTAASQQGPPKRPGASPSLPEPLGLPHYPSAPQLPSQRPPTGPTVQSGSGSNRAKPSGLANELIGGPLGLAQAGLALMQAHRQYQQYQDMYLPQQGQPSVPLFPQTASHQPLPSEPAPLEGVGPPGLPVLAGGVARGGQVIRADPRYSSPFAVSPEVYNRQIRDTLFQYRMGLPDQVRARLAGASVPDLQALGYYGTPPAIPNVLNTVSFRQGYLENLAVNDPVVATALHRVGTSQDLISPRAALQLADFMFLGDTSDINRATQYVRELRNTNPGTPFSRNIHGQIVQHLARNPNLALQYAAVGTYFQNVARPLAVSSEALTGEFENVLKQRPEVIHALAGLDARQASGLPAEAVVSRAMINFVTNQYDPKALDSQTRDVLQAATQKFITNLQKSGLKYRDNRGQVIEVASLDPSSPEMRFLAASVLGASFASSTYASQVASRAVGGADKLRDYFLLMAQSSDEERQRFVESRPWMRGRNLEQVKEEAEAALRIYQSAKVRTTAQALSSLFPGDLNVDLSWIRESVGDSNALPDWVRKFQGNVLDAFGREHRDEVRAGLQVPVYGTAYALGARAGRNLRTPMPSLGGILGTWMVDAAQIYGLDPTDPNFGQMRSIQQGADDFTHRFIGPEAWRQNLLSDAARAAFRWAGSDFDAWLDSSPTLQGLHQRFLHPVGTGIGAVYSAPSFIHGALSTAAVSQEQSDLERLRQRGMTMRESGRRAVDATKALQEFHARPAQENASFSVTDPSTGMAVQVPTTLPNQVIQQGRTQLLQALSSPEFLYAPVKSESDYAFRVGKETGVDRLFYNVLDSAYHEHVRQLSQIADKLRSQGVNTSAAGLDTYLSLLSPKASPNVVRDFSLALYRAQASLPIFESSYFTPAAFNTDDYVRQYYFSLDAQPGQGRYAVTPAERTWFGRNWERLTGEEQAPVHGVFQAAHSGVMDVMARGLGAPSDNSGAIASARHPHEAFAKFAYLDGWRRYLHKQLYENYQRMSGIYELLTNPGQASRSGLASDPTIQKEYQNLVRQFGGQVPPAVVQSLGESLKLARLTLLALEAQREKSFRMRDHFLKFKALQDFAFSGQMPSVVRPDVLPVTFQNRRYQIYAPIYTPQDLMRGGYEAPSIVEQSSPSRPETTALR